MKKARENIIPVFVPHYGCPNNCVFCNQNRISGAEEPATPDGVVQTVTEAKKLLPSDVIPQLAFYGGSFTAIPEKDQIALLSVAKSFLDAGDISSIRLSTRPDAIDDEVIKRLKHYGVSTVEIGAQSMNDEVLKLSGRGHTAEDVVNAAEMIKESGLKLILQMMTGLPGDSTERSLETAEKIISLSPDGVRIYPTVIVKDTMLYDNYLSGRYKEHTVEDAVELCAKMLPLFENAGIPVIRLGLNPTDDLSGGDAVGGAYHPALGEMVKSRILRNEAETLLAGIPEGCDCVLGVSSSRLSQMIGQHHCNEVYLKNLFKMHSIKIKSTDVSGDEVTIVSIDKL